MSPAERRDLHSSAASLLDCHVHGLTPIRGGGNNEVFRVDSTRGLFALKRYSVSDNNGRDRLGHEYQALSVLNGLGETAVPRPIAADREANLAVYDWVPGTPVSRFREGEIGEALAFLERLRDYGCQPAANRLLPAVEACTGLASLRAQVEKRLAVLVQVSERENRLTRFLTSCFIPAWQEIEMSATEAGPLDRAFLTLSPSDFGKHNMLRRFQGSLVFLDFEYFGWDDPVKLVADLVWHPGSALTPSERDQFIGGSQKIFGNDPGYSARFASWAPLLALRWALIVLADFIPERWERRLCVDERVDWEGVKGRQLIKATDLVENSLQFCLNARVQPPGSAIPK